MKPLIQTSVPQKKKKKKKKPDHSKAVDDRLRGLNSPWKQEEVTRVQNEDCILQDPSEDHEVCGESSVGRTEDKR
jgi:hypothetical protein